LPVRARAAKTGVYQYAGREIDPTNAHGLRDQAVVNVLRDEATVFDQSAVRTFIGKPITIDHPSVPVTSTNWKDFARGTVMGALRDGDHLAFDLLLTDEAAINDVRAGKVQVSNGYSATLAFGDFTAPDGTKCPVRQERISDGNHVAIVDMARGGETCRLADVAICDTAPRSIFDSLTTQEKPMKTMLIDGLTIDVSNADTAVATIQTLINARDAAAKTAGEHVATIAAKDTEIAKLATEKKALEDAKPTPAQLRDAAKNYAQVAGKAKAIGVDVTDSMDEPAIMAAAVHAKMGDVAKNWNADAIAASFAVLTKDTKVTDSTVVPIGAPTMLGDGATVRDLIKRNRNAA